MCEKDKEPFLNHVMGFGVAGQVGMDNAQNLQAKTPDFSIKDGYSAMQGIDRSNRPRSPLEVELAMRLYYSPRFSGPHPEAYWEAMDRFVRLGLATKIEDSSGLSYVGNHAALLIYVEKLLSIPFPEQRWFIP